ncbi:hypothetical protein CR513_44173, partial [Mucuna pruriens]
MRCIALEHQEPRVGYMPPVWGETHVVWVLRQRANHLKCTNAVYGIEFVNAELGSWIRFELVFRKSSANPSKSILSLLSHGSLGQAQCYSYVTALGRGGVGDTGCVVPAVVHPIYTAKAGSTIRAKIWTHTSIAKFHDFVGEDPHKHLKEFHVVCSMMRPQGILEVYIKMKAFPFSLDGATKDWLYLKPIKFNMWGDMKRMFLEKFFLAFRIATIRKEICGIRKHSRETLHGYWERFNKFLLMMDRNMVDVASGGALMDKTPAVARHLISNMASNTQQFGTRGGVVTSRVLAVGQHQQNTKQVCGICTSVEHPTEMCPTLQEIELESTECIGAVVGRYQYRRKLYPNLFNFEAAIPTEFESRVVYNTEIWTSWERVGSESE